MTVVDGKADVKAGAMANRTECMGQGTYLGLFRQTLGIGLAALVRVRLNRVVIWAQPEQKRLLL